MNYYFITDVGTQWFSCIVKLDGDDVKEKIEVPTSIYGEFLNNIFSRELHFKNRKVRDDYYYGWSLSEKEFLNIKRLTELLPSVNEFQARLNS